MRAENVEKLGPVHRRGKTMLVSLYGLRHGFEGTKLTCFEAARLVHFDTYEGQRNTYVYNEIRSGYVVSVPSLDALNILKEEDCGSGNMRAYAVVRVLRGPDGRLWTITMPMVEMKGREEVGMSASPEGCIVIELTKHVRRAGTSHICDDKCKPLERALGIKHSKEVLEGGVYEIWTRRDNYPPHMA